MPCAFSSLNAGTKSKAEPSCRMPRATRYRRSTVTKAPRKRTFIANMMKQLVEVSLPSGLEGESFFGASTLCLTAAPCWCRGISGVPAAGAMSTAAIPETTNGGAGRFGGRGGGAGRMGGGGGDSFSDDAEHGDGESSGDEGLAIVPLAVALAVLAAVMYPALEYLAPPTAVTVVVMPVETAVIAPAAAVMVPEVQQAAAPLPPAAAGVVSEPCSDESEGQMGELVLAVA